MPIEIRELVIRAVVDSDVDDTDTGFGSQAADEIVAACVQEVLRVLRRTEER